MKKSATLELLENIERVFDSKELNTLDEIYSKVSQLTLESHGDIFSEVIISTSEIVNKSYTIVDELSYFDMKIFFGIKIVSLDSTSSEIAQLLLYNIKCKIKRYLQIKALNESIKKANESNKAKDNFLANMSHELRTPLNAISGFSQIILMRSDTPKKIQSYVEKISIAGNNLLEQVNTILDFAKLEAGKMSFSPAFSDIGDILIECETLTQAQAKKRNITLHFPVIKSLNLFVDKSLFKQVVLNLISNAIKFSHENSNINIKVLYDVAKKAYLFSVCDSGVGISKESIKTLFEPYSQAKNNHSNAKGTGLGLSISKKIITELHGGTIWCESEENRGSCFYFSIPTVQKEPQLIQGSGTKDGVKLLIVEDSEVYQRILSSRLKNICNISLTDSVLGAEKLLEKSSFDFILLDFFLSDGTGSEVLENMLMNSISIPTIVISTEDDDYLNDFVSEYDNLLEIINKSDIDLIEAKILENI
ncbi:MAG: ATP-binding protein [Campylobacterota bacterium]|nr:ATP-binding protein [Campylobacterota bacterium]